MIRVNGTLACEWCNGDALWGVDTPRGHRDMCQRHYDEYVKERNARSLDNLPESMLALLREYRGMVTR